MDKASPFLKWAGGKKWLARILADCLPKITGMYYEPFLGGGSMYFAVLPKTAVLSDTNDWLIKTYLAVQEAPEKINNHLADWTNSQDDYYKIRASRFTDKYLKAAQFIYLNKTGWNGLYRVNKNGDFNVPFGNNQREIINNQDLYLASKALQGARFEVCDFERAISDAKQGDLVYFDPPYTVLHSENGFRRYNESLFSWDDQLRLAKIAAILAEKGCKVIVSNADHREVINLYDNFFYLSIMRNSTIASNVKARRKTTEALFLSFEISSEAQIFERFINNAK
jgi:DNA adenine methylase